MKVFQQVENDNGEHKPRGIAIFESDGVVHVAIGSKKSGVSKSGKKWSRWDNKSKYFFSTRTGHLKVFSRSGKHMQDITALDSSMNRIEITWAGSWIQRSELSQQYRNALSESLSHLGIDWNPESNLARTVWDSAYPVLSGTGIRPEQGLGGALRESDMKAVVQHALGKTRYRRDLARGIVEHGNLKGLVLARQIRQLAPADWLVPVIKGFRNTANVELYQTREVLSRIRPHQLRLLLANLPDSDARDFGDSIRQLSQLPLAAEIPRENTWRGLHDALMPHIIRYQDMRENREIEPTKIAKKLDGLEVGDMRLVHAQDTDTLVQWGSEMHHCIGSYGNAATTGSSVLFGLYRGEELLANLELSRNGEVRQFYGRFNQTPGESVSKPVIAGIKKELRKTSKLDTRD